jgi:hypothetical protein
MVAFTLPLGMAEGSPKDPTAEGRRRSSPVERDNRSQDVLEWSLDRRVEEPVEGGGVAFGAEQ